jgi:hypothetical protein
MAGSMLEGLRARRDELAQEQVRDLAVPRWENPKAALKIKPIDHDLIKRQLGRIEKAKAGARAAVEVSANAAIIATATTAVVLGEGDGEAVVPLADLAEPLGLSSDATGAEIIQAFMLTDGDVISCAGAVMKHSGYAQRDLDDELAGE